MADISTELQQILDAVYGEQVRGSIYRAIKLINDVSEVVISVGTDITSPTSSSTGYFTDSLYINTDTCDLWKCTGTDTWVLVGNIRGIGITSIAKTGTSGLVDTYTITYSDSTTTTFSITNGNGIDNIAKTSTSGLIDTYTITYEDGTTTTFSVTNGKDGINGTNGTNGISVTGVTLISKVGLVATYRMSFSDGSHFDYTVSDGAAGTGTGDMTKAVYDTDGDGIVDAAETIYGLTATIADLNKTANLKTVATSGSYNDLTNKPTIPAAQVNADWNANSGVARILNKPTIPTVDQTYSATSINAQSGKAVAQALSSYEQPLVKNAGSKTWNDLITNASTYLTASNANKFYRLSTAGAVTSANESLFVDGIVEGEHFSVDSHIAVVEVSAGVYKYDYFGGGIEPEVYFESSGNSLSYTFTHDAINENSTINLYSNIVGDKYTNISVSVHTCTVTMAVAQARTLTIYVK